MFGRQHRESHVHVSAVLVPFCKVLCFGSLSGSSKEVGVSAAVATALRSSGGMDESSIIISISSSRTRSNDSFSSSAASGSRIITFRIVRAHLWLQNFTFHVVRAHLRFKDCWSPFLELQMLEIHAFASQLEVSLNIVLVACWFPGPLNAGRC